MAGIMFKMILVKRFASRGKEIQIEGVCSLLPKRFQETVVGEESVGQEEQIKAVLSK